MTDNTQMLTELVSNTKAKSQKFATLLATYEAAKVGYDMQEEQSNDCYNDVLKAHEFYASEDGSRLGINIGDRITDQENAFLLSDADFEKLQNMAMQLLVARKITDKDGYYLVKWLDIKTSAERDLIDFYIKEIIPSPMRETL